MHYLRCKKSPVRFSSVGFAALGMLVLGIASCSSPRNPSQGEAPDYSDGWPKPNQAFSQAAYRPIQVALPEVAGAEMVGDDSLCESCHETYLKSFADNVHGMHADATCESCHGPASRHLETRGQEPGLINSFKTLNSCEKSEICLQCHEDNACSPGARWRTSVHAHKGVSCTDCHRAHYNVPYGTPATSEQGDTTAAPWGNDPLALIRGQNSVDQMSYQVESNNLGATAPGICYQCHSDFRTLQTIAG
ncbi:MAG TPA: multiheme c-type cytochrome, partial [Thermoguttaceae bacterium]|nr:multiheme c-type cytochrome [Thermoguttaceae bacterium]